MANFCDFREEIVFQILSWLPVIYVFRCRSVCKQWLSIISDPLFTQTHLTNSHKRPSVLAFAETSHGSKYGFYGISSSFKDSANLHVPLSLAGNQDYWGLASCNGLVCLSDYKAIDIYLWNPSTRQCCKILPPPKIPSKKWAFIGFYFDSISNDYKILRINVYYNFPVRVELYSTNSNTWREIKVDEVDTSLALMIGCGPVIEGALYINGRDELISFQLHNEMFKSVPLPSTELRVVMNSRSSIFDYEGHVGLILHCHHDETLSLWSLVEDDGNGIVSWTKNFNFVTNFKLGFPTTYLGDGKLVTSDNRKRIILYDYKSKEIKKFRHPTWHFVKSLHNYTESLVSLKVLKK